MNELATERLSRACRIFLRLAYPDGEATIPPPRRAYLGFGPFEARATWFAPPLCQPICAPEGGTRGYAWRLGCRDFPHLKLRATWQGDEWVFAVDTHDMVQVPADHPDAPRWAGLQESNRRLKEQIEQSWEEAGLLTFAALLRRDLDRA